jgi:hypothetical protein
MIMIVEIVTVKVMGTSLKQPPGGLLPEVTLNLKPPGGYQIMTPSVMVNPPFVIGRKNERGDETAVILWHSEGQLTF